MIEDEEFALAPFDTIECDECWGRSVINSRFMLCTTHRNDVERVHLTTGQLLARRAANKRRNAEKRKRDPRTQEFR